MSRFAPAHTHTLDLPAEVLAEIDAAWERAQDPSPTSSSCTSTLGSVNGRVRGETAPPAAAGSGAPVRLGGARDRLRVAEFALAA